MEKTAFEKKYAVERRGTRSVKWDGLAGKFGDPDLIALWVADMDFKCPDSVREALAKTVEHGAFGYYDVPQSYYDAFIAWEKERHGYEVKQEWLRYTPGVVAGIFGSVNAFSAPGDACMVLSPVYSPFMNAIEQNGRKLVCCPLVEENGVYSVNFTDFEQKIVDNNVKIFILCSPHNPIGRVWRREELEKFLEICRKYHVFVISDEIHQDIIMSGYTQIPTATVGNYHDMLITLTAPSKTFNLAGCQNSIAIIPDEKVRAQFETSCKVMNIFGGSSFGYIAAEAAYAQGAQWLEGALETIERNYRYLRDTLTKELPGVVVSPLEGTYLAWIDLKAVLGGRGLVETVQDKARLAVDFGDWFIRDETAKDDRHIRVNLAASGDIVEQAVANLIKAIR